MWFRTMRLVSALLLVLPLAASTDTPSPDPEQLGARQEARQILKQLIEINTTDSVGDNTRAAEAMAARFRQAGFPESDIHVLSPVPRKGNLVVRLRGSGAARPILFLGHLDVVEANRADWSFDPFTLLEKDGYFYGRGTEDTKGNDATMVEAFLRIKRSGLRPARDFILALTANEEGGTPNGVDWLLKNHRDLFDAEFSINTDAGSGVIKNGRRLYMELEAAEKVFLSFKLTVTNPGGHSSRPSKDNAIYHLAEGLGRLAHYDFPVQLFDVTRANFERLAPFYKGQLSADLKAITANPNDAAVVARLSASPLYNAELRTTCVPTMLSGGHAENALPQTATAVVNCRLLPIDKAEDVERTLTTVLADTAIKISVMTPAKSSRISPMNPLVLAAVSEATNKIWPGLKVVPYMGTGASDGVYLRAAGIPTYGVSGIFVDEDDSRAHGRDERILVQSFDEAVDFLYDLAISLGNSR